MRKLIQMILAILWVSVCLSGCSAEEPSQEKQANNPSASSSLIRALENADRFFSYMEGTTKSSRRVESIKVVTDNQVTKNSNSDTLLYLVNYQDNAGFALLGADERMSDIYAISPEGHLEYSDTIGFTPLKVFIDNAESHAKAALLSDSPISSNIKVSIVAKYKIDPLITSDNRLWDQQSPYNTYCKTPLGKQSYPGCLAVALGEYLAFHQWPSSYNGFIFSWRLINGNIRVDAVAKFFRRLGDADLLNVAYSLNSGDADSNRIRPSLEQLGYNIDDAYFDIPLTNNYQKFKSAMNSNNTHIPVLMTGFTYDNNFNRLGHAWIVDGLVERVIRRVNTITHMVTELPTAPLLHIIWGWKGRYNGYYAIYQTEGSIGNDRIDREDYENKNDSILPGGYHFNMNLRFYGGMLPNK